MPDPFAHDILATWELGADTAIHAVGRRDGKADVLVNDGPSMGRVDLKQSNTLRFDLPDSRAVAIAVKPRPLAKPELQLRVNGLLMRPSGSELLQCRNCGARVGPNDRFCQGCGQKLRTSEERRHGQQVAQATTMIWIVAGVFVLAGAFMFFLQRSAASRALQRLSGLPADRVLPVAIHGSRHTVAQVRHMLAWEPWGVLAVNLVIAGALAATALWSRRSPLPAVLTAAGIYGVVLVGNALVAPVTLVQGLVLKIVIISALARGVQSAFALRSAATVVAR